MILKVLAFLFTLLLCVSCAAPTLSLKFEALDSALETPLWLGERGETIGEEGEDRLFFRMPPSREGEQGARVFFAVVPSIPPETLCSEGIPKVEGWWLFRGAPEEAPAIALGLGADGVARWAGVDLTRDCLIDWPIAGIQPKFPLGVLSTSARGISNDEEHAAAAAKEAAMIVLGVLPGYDFEASELFNDGVERAKFDPLLRALDLELLSSSLGDERVVLGELGFSLQSAGGEELGRWSFGGALEYQMAMALRSGEVRLPPLTNGVDFYKRSVHEVITLEQETIVALEVYREGEALLFRVRFEEVFEGVAGKDGMWDRSEVQRTQILLWRPGREHVKPFTILSSEGRSRYFHGEWGERGRRGEWSSWGHSVGGERAWVTEGGVLRHRWGMVKETARWGEDIEEESSDASDWSFLTHAEDEYLDLFNRGGQR